MAVQRRASIKSVKCKAKGISLDKKQKHREAEKMRKMVKFIPYRSSKASSETGPPRS